ncbi:hypothetical protein UFOVP380_19 [uncultured Caudovirales phage]|uniref:Uncharacterized protein n=1 Tax=uncultured Caudovirales phage TaxID=2100421 RepID=A0A6J7X7F9_9CAUD|nr:hypothetical protein UFOVP380_19 [uncultured Caudovirales phage]
MALLTLELPTEAAWEYEVELDGELYLLRGQSIAPPQKQPYYMLDLLLPDETPIELGMKLTLGARFAWRGQNELAPLGTLFLVATGKLAGDDPTGAELQERVVLVYDEAI